MTTDESRAAAVRMAQAIAAGNLSAWNEIRVSGGRSFEHAVASSTLVAELAAELAHQRGLPAVDFWSELR